MGKTTDKQTITEATWAAAFARYHGGERVADVCAAFGIRKSWFDYEARVRKMRLRDLPVGHPGRSRVPPIAERPADWKARRDVVSEGVWVEIMRRWVNGASGRELAAEFGVSESAIQRQAKDRGLLKRDHPGAKAAPRGLSVTPRPLASPELRKAMAFDLDPDDPAASRASLEASMRVAAARGLTEAVEGLGKAGIVLGRYARIRPSFAEASEGSPLEVGEEAPARPEPVLRDAQRPPEGDWTTWLFLGGRGAGKTLAGAMWLSDQAEALGPGGRLALIGPTLHDVREVMIEGASGIGSLARWRGVERPVFEPSRRRLVFPNGALAHVFSAEDPDSLRGPQFSAAWADEMCAWRGAGETLSLLRMGLRLPGPAPFPLDGGRVGVGGGGRLDPEEAREAGSGDDASCADPSTSAGPPPPRPSPIEGEGALPPRLCITTTPRATQALRALRAEPGLVETHAGTRDNAAHLAAGFVEGLERLYGGTRRAAQEIEGRVVEVEGALWTAEMLAACRGEVEGGFDRVVVALDPTTTAGGNACGIVAAGRCGEAAWVLADRSVAGVGPLEWARRAAALAEELGAAAIVAEVNQGGDMVRTVLKAAGCCVPVKEVRATKGKRVRAEPVAALYEQGRVRHVAGLGRLEEELMAFGGDEAGCDFDRADALVWAITDLLIDKTASGEWGPRIRSFGPSPRSWGIAGRSAGW
jgi:phage terminase large subunit-like protein